MKLVEKRLAANLDRADLKQVLSKYFQGIDRLDFEQVRRCFTENVEATHHNSPAIRGLDDLISTLRKICCADDMRIMTHFMGNFNVDFLEGDFARTETYALSFHVRQGEPGSEIDIRSLRYLDEFKRIDGTWLISRRRHTLDWNFHQKAASAATFATRVARI